MVLVHISNRANFILYKNNTSPPKAKAIRSFRFAFQSFWRHLLSCLLYFSNQSESTFSWTFEEGKIKKGIYVRVTRKMKTLQSSIFNFWTIFFILLLLLFSLLDCTRKSFTSLLLFFFCSRFLCRFSSIFSKNLIYAC